MATITLASKRRRSALRTAAFMSPWLIGFAVFFAYPLISTVYFSFMHYDGFKPPTWSGTKNWTYVFEHYPFFWPALRNTLWLVLVTVTLRVLFGLAIGLLITKIKTGTGVFRTLFYLPYLAPPVASTMAFAFLLNPGTGPVNSILEKLGIPAPGWFNDPAWSKPSLVLLGVWVMGDIMIILLASLLDVPREQYEAASLDGAGGLQKVRYVTLPSISPVLLFAVVTGVIAAIQYFTEAAVASSVASGKAVVGEGIGNTLGYPDGSLLTYTQWLYVRGFGTYQLGYASALAVLLFVVAALILVLLLRRFKAFTPEGAQ